MNDLKNPKNNLDKLYQTISFYNLLPTLYSAINNKQLNHCFNEDFMNTLSYFTSLNAERNQLISAQITHIAKLFNTHSIDYVFVKGAALLVKNVYKSEAYRMIGDIDILVADEDINKANQLFF